MFNKAFDLFVKLAFSTLLVAVMSVMAVIGVGFIQALIAEPMRFFNG